jgi:hypothetical protein
VGDPAEPLTDAIDRYARAAVAVEGSVHGGWAVLGCPALAIGASHGAITVAHPLLDSMRRAPQDAHGLGEPLGLVRPAKSNLHPNLALDRKSCVREH